MKRLSFTLVLLVGALLLYTTGDLPNWGDPLSPASTHLSPYYITHALEDTAIPNIVSAVLADYRGFDTMFETTVVFIAGFILILLLQPSAPAAAKRSWPARDAYGDMIMRTTCRLVFPPMQIFALYVIAHGHHSPGGGFQGGVILGASYILYAISYDVPTVLELFPVRRAVLCACGGILIYAGTGALCVLLGGNFLDYGVLSGMLPLDPAHARSFAVLVIEIGVALTVMSVMYLSYLYLSTHGELEGGL